jgi:transposase
VTRLLLWEEYRQAHVESAYGYSQFCDIYRRWASKLKPSMRQVHKAGEKTFIDYSGKKPHIVDGKTGELIPVELFVAALGASGYTYAEATLTQQLHDWTAAHRHMVEYFEGSTQVWVPDQLRSAVARPCRYEPKLNRSYQELARHYGAVVIPARPGKAKDKGYASYCTPLAGFEADRRIRL